MLCVTRLARLSKNRSLHCNSLIFSRNRKTSTVQNIISRCRHEYVEDEDDSLASEEYEELSREYLGVVKGGHGAFVLQPYVKWGQQKKRNTTPELQLAEAVALLKTLPSWSVIDQMCLPMESLGKNKFLGTGNMEKLRGIIQRNRQITAIFVSTNLLKQVQVQELQYGLGVPIYDRYAVVIQIFRAHATSPEAKLQVALAELPYMWSKLNVMQDNRGGSINLIESRRKLLKSREVKLKTALMKLKGHRELLRSKRKSHSIPSVAVVGYTNAGKTSLIKALTGDDTLKPVDRLFATLDVTAHEGFLPSRLKVLYMDTIGFIQDVPSTLIEPFVATLEDAMIADVILHVHDASHPDRQAQAEHVTSTLKTLVDDKKPIINVANKTDLIQDGTPSRNMLGICATQSIGIDVLRKQIETELLKATGRSVVRVRVESGSRAAAWLYKETTVTNADADPKNPQYMLIDVIATPVQLIKFRQFLKQ